MSSSDTDYNIILNLTNNDRQSQSQLQSQLSLSSSSSSSNSTTSDISGGTESTQQQQSAVIQQVPSTSSTTVADHPTIMSNDEPQTKKQKLTSFNIADLAACSTKKLEERLGGILACTVCLDDSKSTIYQVITVSNQPTPFIPSNFNLISTYHSLLLVYQWSFDVLCLFYSPFN